MDSKTPEQPGQPNNAYASPDAAQLVDRPRRRGRLTPPIWVWLLIGVVVGLIVWVRNVPGDHAMANVFTFLLSFVASSIIGVWFLLLSGYSWWFRGLVTLGSVAGIVLFFSAFEIAHVSGEMVPTFRLRASPPPDALLEAPVPPADVADVDLSRTTPQDFPQFLGPDRDASLDEIALDTDWESHPPQQVWRQPIGAGWSGFVAVNGFAVTLEQRGDRELVTCYRIEDGKPMWSHGEATRHSTVLGGVGPRSTPTIHGGRVYALGATGNLLCLDGVTGKVVWQDNILRRYGVPLEKDLQAVAWGRACSPLIVDNLVVVAVGGPKDGIQHSLAAFNKESGELVWEAGHRQVSYASPTVAVVAGRRQILSVNEDNVTGHDPETGQVLWTIPWPGSSFQDASASQAIPLGDKRIFLSKGYNGGAAVWQIVDDGSNKLTPQEVWADPTLLKTKFTNVTIHAGHAYGLSDGILECVDLETGKRKWKRGRYGHGQILRVGDSILVQAESGDVVLVAASPDGHEELGKLPSAIEGQTWNNLCLTGEYLLVRNAEEAACYRIKLAEPAQ